MGRTANICPECHQEHAQPGLCSICADLHTPFSMEVPCEPEITKTPIPMPTGKPVVSGSPKPELQPSPQAAPIKPRPKVPAAIQPAASGPGSSERSASARPTAADHKRLADLLATLAATEDRQRAGRLRWDIRVLCEHANLPVPPEAARKKHAAMPAALSAACDTLSLRDTLTAIRSVLKAEGLTREELIERCRQLMDRDMEIEHLRETLREERAAAIRTLEELETVRAAANWTPEPQVVPVREPVTLGDMRQALCLRLANRLVYDPTDDLRVVALAANELYRMAGSGA